MVLLFYMFLMPSVTVGSVLFPSPERLLPNFDVVQNAVCRQHWMAFLEGLRSFRVWAVQMFDASAKYPTGLLVRNGFVLGQFDECLSVSADLGVAGGGLVEGQYCLVDIYFSFNVSLASNLSLDYNSLDSVWIKLRDTGNSSQVLHWAMCVPASCSSEDIQLALDATLAHLQAPFTILADVKPQMCQTHYSITAQKLLTMDDVIVLFMAAILVLLVVCSSFYDQMYHQQQKSEVISMPTQFLLCFSIRRNFYYLTKLNLTNTGLDCIHGLRLIFMILAISVHRFLIVFRGPMIDSIVADQSYKEWYNMFFLNGMIVVDTFFVYSGLLTAYYLPQELNDKKHLTPFIIWLYRFIRLTPLYLAVLLINTTLLNHLGSGPLWPTYLGLEQRRCSQNWWLNVIYLNNYINTDQMCMFQTWYLAVDTHLFMVAVVVIYYMCRWPPVGNIMMAVFSFIAIMVPFIEIFFTRSDPFLLIHPDVVKDLASSPHFLEMYAVSHMRAGPYVVGMAVGSLLYNLKGETVIIPKILLYGGHICCIFLCLIVQYAGFAFYTHGASYYRLGSILYGALHRVIWGVAVALNIFLLVHGRIEWLHQVLTWPPLVPVSRLTYCAYLIHTVPHLYELSVLRTSQHFSFYTGVWMFVGDIFFTFLISLALCLLIEAPFRGMERIVFGLRKIPLDANNKSAQIDKR